MKKIMKVMLVVIYVILLYYSYKNAVLNLESYKNIVSELGKRGMDSNKFQNILMVIMMIVSIAILFLQIGFTSILNYYLIKFLYMRDNFSMELRSHFRIQIQLLILLIPKLALKLIAPNYSATIIIEKLFGVIGLFFLCFLYNKKLPSEDYKKEKRIFYIIQVFIGILSLILNI